MSAEAEAFFLGFHRQHPGVTSRAFARGRIGQGGSSYAWLADEVPSGAGRILDLGCGDGHLLEVLRARGLACEQLAGVDLSAAELEAAQTRPSLAGVTLVCERAQALSFADASFDCVLSHLALMLMSPVEEVISELARVMSPGGVLATVVGGGPRVGTAFELFLDRFLEAYRAQPRRIPPLGDRRTRTAEGLAELFGAHTGFTPPALRDAYVDLSGPLEEVCDTLMTIYETAALPPPALAAVRASFFKRAQPLASPDGIIPCEMAVRLVTARRLEHS